MLCAIVIGGRGEDRRNDVRLFKLYVLAVRLFHLVGAE